MFAGRMHGLSRPEAAGRTGELLQFLSLAEDASRLTLEYSQGMKKKLALAAALIHNPKVLFLDEPLNGIDPISARVVTDLLQRLTRKGVTLFFTTHVLDVVERLCDEVAIIDHGRIVAQGSLEDIRMPEAGSAGRHPGGRLPEAGGGRRDADGPVVDRLIALVGLRAQARAAGAPRSARAGGRAPAARAGPAPGHGRDLGSRLFRGADPGPQRARAPRAGPFRGRDVRGAPLGPFPPPHGSGPDGNPRPHPPSRLPRALPYPARVVSPRQPRGARGPGQAPRGARVLRGAREPAFRTAHRRPLRPPRLRADARGRPDRRPRPAGTVPQAARRTTARCSWASPSVSW